MISAMVAGDIEVAVRDSCWQVCNDHTMMSESEKWAENFMLPMIRSVSPDSRFSLRCIILTERTCALRDESMNAEAASSRRGVRSRIVCQRCHDKKNRCDMQRINGTCTACLEATAHCTFRPCRKGHHRRRQDPEVFISPSRTSGPDWVEEQASQLRREVFDVRDDVGALL